MITLNIKWSLDSMAQCFWLRRQIVSIKTHLDGASILQHEPPNPHLIMALSLPPQAGRMAGVQGAWYLGDGINYIWGFAIFSGAQDHMEKSLEIWNQENDSLFCRLKEIWLQCFTQIITIHLTNYKFHDWLLTESQECGQKKTQSLE